jgi:uncharacterized RDD family membrane protein YckC
LYEFGQEFFCIGQPPYAGFWWRFLAMLIDSVILQAAACLMGLGLGLLYGIALGSLGSQEITKSMFELILNLVSFGVGVVSGWLYFACQESSEWQATVGKRVCGLKVTDAEGCRISFKKATGRYFGKILSGFTCAVGYIIAAFTEKRQALHDIIAGTLVMKP